MDIEGGTVMVVIECKAGTVWVENGERLQIQSWEEREWRHLDTMQLATRLRARVPRVRYADGSTGMVNAPWAGERSRWTLAFEALAVTVLKNARSRSAAAEFLKLDWKGLQRIMERSVKRGLLRRSLEGIKTVGLDEKSFGEGQDYIRVLSDPAGKRVLDVVPGRTQADAQKLLETLPKEQRAKVQSVSIDMSAGFDPSKTTAPQSSFTSGNSTSYPHNKHFFPHQLAKNPGTSNSKRQRFAIGLPSTRSMP